MAGRELDRAWRRRLRRAAIAPVLPWGTEAERRRSDDDRRGRAERRSAGPAAARSVARHDRARRIRGRRRYRSAASRRGARRAARRRSSSAASPGCTARSGAGRLRSSAARCSRPVSTPTTNAARAIIRATPSSGCMVGTRAPGTARRSRRCAAARPRCPTAARRKSARRKRARKLDPARHRPLLLGPRGRVQQNDVTRTLAGAQRRAIETEVGRSVGRIAEHLGGRACGCA